MATIPIRKLNDGTTSYYPLSVGESVVTTSNITVQADIGGYKKNDIITATTNLDTIVKKLCNGTPVVVDTQMSDTSTNAVQNKVIKAAIDKKVEGTIGESKIFNESTGGGAKYTSESSGITSFVGVNDPESTGLTKDIAAQMYVKHGTTETKINAYDGKFCYVKGVNPDSEDEKAKRELVVKDDLNIKRSVNDLAVYEQGYTDWKGSDMTESKWQEYVAYGQSPAWLYSDYEPHYAWRKPNGLVVLSTDKNATTLTYDAELPEQAGSTQITVTRQPTGYYVPGTDTICKTTDVNADRIVSIFQSMTTAQVDNIKAVLGLI